MSKKRRPSVLDDPKVAAIYHKSHRDIAERLYNKASNDATAWRQVAEELAKENAQLRAELAVPAVAEAVKAHRDAKENPFADSDELRGEGSGT